MKTVKEMPAPTTVASYGLSSVPNEFTVYHHPINPETFDKKVLKWINRGFPFPPPIGTKVHIIFNGLGDGKVISYFFEHGFLGVQVKLDNEPKWHIKQTKGDWHRGTALVFGSEIEPVK